MFRKLKAIWGSGTEADPQLAIAQKAVDQQFRTAVKQRDHAEKVASYLSRSRHENHYAPRLRAAFELERKPS